MHEFDLIFGLIPRKGSNGVVLRRLVACTRATKIGVIMASKAAFIDGFTASNAVFILCGMIPRVWDRLDMSFMVLEHLARCSKWNLMFGFDPARGDRLDMRFKVLEHLVDVWD